MKLAEALNLRSSLMQQVSQLSSRLDDCVRIQEGDEPVESAEEVIKELDSKLDELYRLVYLINLTNSQTFENDKSITELLAERERLSRRSRILSDALKRLTERDSRYHTTEIKYVRTVDPVVFRKLCDECSSQLRQLNLRIQMLGWERDLLEA